MIALLVVALSVSMAAADDTGLSVDSATFAFSDDAVEANVFTVKWTDDQNQQTIYAGWRIQKKVDDVWVNVDDEVAISEAGADAFAPIGSHEFAAGTSRSYDIKDVGKTESQAGDLYRIRFENTQGYYDEGDFRVTTKGDLNIPEFATLAIPVVALLGLVLFMRRKKD